MPTHSNAYIITFVFIVSTICAFLLASVSTGLKSRQSHNELLDKQKNILQCFGILPQERNTQTISKAFKDIYSIVLDYQGNVLPGINADQINPDEERKKQDQAFAKHKKATELVERAKRNEDKKILERVEVEEKQAKILWRKCHFPLYILKDQKEQAQAYLIPILGNGLWGKLYGYLALEKDLNTIRGITFYKTKETPGLGKEIEKAYYQAKFKEKKILDAMGKFVSISVIKGKAADRYELPKLSHYVDGISGSTITCDGVTEMLRKDLLFYQAYFSKHRHEKTAKE